MGKLMFMYMLDRTSMLLKDFDSIYSIVSNKRYCSCTAYCAQITVSHMAYLIVTTVVSCKFCLPRLQDTWVSYFHSHSKA